MKTLMVLLLTCVTFYVTSQIKIFPGGLQSYGSTTSPASGEKHKFTGDMVISSSAAPGGSAIRLRGNNGYSTASTPDYTWLGNDQTGLFHPASNIIGFAIGGSEKFRMNSSGQLLNSNSTSSASTPDFSWNSDANTGFFRPANDVIGFTTGGAERARLTSTGNLLLGTTGELNSRFVASATNNCAISAVATHTTDNAYCQINYVNRDLTKALSVLNNAGGSYVETYTLKGSGDVWERSSTITSDRNLKENIDSLQNSLSKLTQLKGVKYNFKRSFTGPGPLRTELGLIAQDVELVFPEAVNTNENGMKGIMYHSLVPVLIEAIKELDRKNSQLQSDINTCCSKGSDGKSNRLINSTGNADLPEDGTSYLKQNKPNPFNRETVIEYNVTEQGTAGILVFDMNGRLLKTIPVKIPGKGSITISANDFEPGMYYYTLLVNDKEVDTKKMILTQ